MRRHLPFVMKDPRMALTMNLWMPKLRNPVCLFVFKDPTETTVSLSMNAKKSASRSATHPPALPALTRAVLHALSFEVEPHLQRVYCGLTTMSAPHTRHYHCTIT